MVNCENCKSEDIKYIGVHSYDEKPYMRDVYECNTCTCTFSVEVGSEGSKMAEVGKYHCPRDDCNELSQDEEHCGICACVIGICHREVCEHRQIPEKKVFLSCHGCIVFVKNGYNTGLGWSHLCNRSDGNCHGTGCIEYGLMKYWKDHFLDFVKQVKTL